MVITILAAQTNGLIYLRFTPFDNQRRNLVWTLVVDVQLDDVVRFTRFTDQVINLLTCLQTHLGFPSDKHSRPLG